MAPHYSVLQPLLETPISAIVFMLQPEVMFVGVVMVKVELELVYTEHNMA